MDPAAELAFRGSLVDEGAMDEILRVLVALDEVPDAKADPMDYFLKNLGAGTLPPLHTRPPTGSYELLEENKRLKEAVADLRAKLKDAHAQLKEGLPPATLIICCVSAQGVPDTNVLHVSLLDVPYLDDEDSVSEVAAQTTIGSGEDLSIGVPAGVPRPVRALVRLGDDAIASAEVELDAAGGSFEELTLKGAGELPDVIVSFEYKFE